MKKIGLIIGGVFAALLFAYGSLSALVNQGLSLVGAIVVFTLIMGGGIAMLMLAGQKPDAPDQRDRPD